MRIFLFILLVLSYSTANSQEKFKYKKGETILTIKISGLSNFAKVDGNHKIKVKINSKWVYSLTDSVKILCPVGDQLKIEVQPGAFHIPQSQEQNLKYLYLDYIGYQPIPLTYNLTDSISGAIKLNRTSNREQ